MKVIDNEGMKLWSISAGTYGKSLLELMVKRVENVKQQKCSRLVVEFIVDSIPVVISHHLNAAMLLIKSLEWNKGEYY